MSAWQCSPEHIFALAKAWVHFRSKYEHEPLLDDVKAYARKLAVENVKSLKYRYPNDSWDPVETDHLIKPEIFVWSNSGALPGQKTEDIVKAVVTTLKLINCYNYQSCEHPGWKTSRVKQDMDGLYRHVAETLPGYDDAPWGI
jgi:hypothetical protein